MSRQPAHERDLVAAIRELTEVTRELAMVTKGLVGVLIEDREAEAAEQAQGADDPRPYL